MAQNVDSVLSRTAVFSDEQTYRLLRLPSNGITLAAGVVAEASLAFNAMIVDKDEVTLLLPEEVCEEFSRRLRLAAPCAVDYRLITFEAQLEPNLVGFIARISAALADAGIPILVYGSFSRDHIFVPEAHFKAALETINALQAKILATGERS